VGLTVLLYSSQTKVNAIAISTIVRPAISCGIIIFALIGIIGIFAPAEVELGRVSNPPHPPTNPEPPTGKTGITATSILLRWNYYRCYGYDRIDKWHIKVSTVEPCNSDSVPGNIVDAEIEQNTYFLSGLEMDTIYYWAVKAHNDQGWSIWSNWYFVTNARPIANIISINPNPVIEGEMIYFVGNGSDPVDNDLIVGYLWDSNIDGILSANKTFETTNLSLGLHIISLKVQDAAGLWSEPVTCNLSIEFNYPPTVPTNIQPTITHDLTPTLVWNASTDPENYRITYHLCIWEGTDSINGSLIISNVSTDTPSYNVHIELSYGSGINPYYIELYAKDKLSKVSDTAKQIFYIVNEHPVAIITSPKNGSLFIVHEPIIFNASLSYDPDNDDLTYNWYSNLSGALNIAPTFIDDTLSPGNHKIKLNVSDGNGFYDIAEVYIYIDADTDHDGLANCMDLDDDNDKLSEHTNLTSYSIENDTDDTCILDEDDDTSASAPNSGKLETPRVRYNLSIFATVGSLITLLIGTITYTIFKRG
jgi:hypothetical protein